MRTLLRILLIAIGLVTLNGCSNGIAEDGPWTTYNIAKWRGPYNPYLRTVFEASDGTVWIAADRGLGKVSPDGSFQLLSTGDAHPKGGPYSIVQASDGSLWFSGWVSGIIQLTPDGVWRTHPECGEGLETLEATNGDLWFARGDGFCQYTFDGQWRTYNDGFRRNWGYSTVAATDGSVWFGGESFIIHFSPDGALTKIPNDICPCRFGGTETSDGSIWFGSRSGALRLAPDGTWTTFTTEDGLIGNYVFSIAEARDGSIWFGTGSGKGASRLAPDGAWTSVTAEDGLKLQSEYSIVQAIHEASDGSIWFGISDGVSRLSPDGKWTTFTEDDGLSDNDVDDILEAHDGSIWFSHGRSVTRLDPVAAGITTGP